MSFEYRTKSRAGLLQEDNNIYGGASFGQKMKDGAKNNWGKMLGAGLAGAAGATALAVGNEDINDTINDWHEMDNNDTLANHFIDKAQNGLESLKGDNAGAAGLSLGGSGTAHGTVADGSGAVSNFGNSSGGSSNLDTSKLHEIAGRHADNSFSGRYGADSGAFPQHMKSIFTGKPDVTIDSMTQADVNNYTLQHNQQYQQDLAEYNKALQQANQDGYVSPEETERINALKEKLDSNNLSLWEKAQGLIYGDDKIQAEKFAEQQLAKSVEFAKQNNLDFLLNGNTQDDYNFFQNIIHQYGKVPDELQPIYQQVMRKAQG